MSKQQHESAFLARWRMVEMELWDEGNFDLCGEAHFEFSKGRQGGFSFVCVRGFMDCRFSGSADASRVDFSWEGHDEDMPVSGRGWAVIDGEFLEGRIFIHNADDSSFRARRSDAPNRSAKRPR
ncbi:MAG: hypothetical protein AB8I08_34540 [Sandaracinaceae bacterium]